MKFAGLWLAWLAVSAGALAQDAGPRPDWLGKEPLITVGNWDSMPLFRTRAGGNGLDMEANYARMLTEEAVQKLQDLGVTMAIIHFYKGFGLKAEAEHIADAKKLAALLHRHGIRVGVYVGSTMGYETFLAERPDAKDWLVDFLGHPLYYSGQQFRKRVYFMHPGYREYIKGVLRVALEDLHADLIHFDNTSMQAQAPIFTHPLAVADFRAFLEKKFTPAERKARFGYPEVEYMEAPVIERQLATIDDPQYQEWADFRCVQLTAYYAEMEKFIRGLNPQAAVDSNPHFGISGTNTVWEEGVDYPRLLAHMDLVWTEEGNPAQVTPAGILVTKIRTYKMAALLHNRIFTYTGGEQGGELQMAESMAFNRQMLGQIGDLLAGYSFPEKQRTYVDFFRKNFDLFRGVESRPDVAVLHSYASMAFNNDLPWQSSMLVEQVLIQAKIPFEIIFDRQLSDLSKYKALVLADQESLDDAQMGAIRKYVQAGGGLVATEQTSLYDNWRRRRDNYGLHDVFGVDAPPYRQNLYTARPTSSASPSNSEAAISATPVRRTVGGGRSSYLVAVRAAMAKPPGAPMTSAYWKLPLNAQEIAAEVRWAARDISLDVQGPATLVAEPLVQPETGRLLIHLLNYDTSSHPSVENVAVSVRIPAGKTVHSVRVVSPDAPAVTVTPVVQNGMAAFTVPRIGTYSIAVLELR